MNGVWMRIDEVLTNRQIISRVLNYRTEKVSPELLDYLYGPAMAGWLLRFGRYKVQELRVMKVLLDEELNHMLSKACYEY